MFIWNSATLRTAVLAAYLGTVACAAPVQAQRGVAEIATAAEPAVYHVITELGNGTAFLVDSDEGLLVTNAHVTFGQQQVTVRLDAVYKVAAQLVLEDRRRDLAVLRVSPRAVSDRVELRLDPTGASTAQIGDPIVVMGYPLFRGVVTTTGIVSGTSGDLLMTDARVSPGNSGGPVFNGEGSVVGVLTFLAAHSTGSGLGGAIPAATVEAMLVEARSALAGEPPAPDSLPTMPLDYFPIEVLEQAVAAEDWPTDLYDISNKGTLPGFNVSVFTPPLWVRTDNLEIEDLRYWTLQNGEYPPVVIVRIQPVVGQSRAGFLANLFLGVVGGLADTYLPPVYIPEAKGSYGDIRLHKGGESITPIQVKRARATLDGTPIQVVHLVLSPELFRPEPSGSWEPIIIDIDDPEVGLRAWVIADRLIEQVYRDFEAYLDGTEFR